MEELPPRGPKLGALETPSLGLSMVRGGSKFLEAASAVGGKASQNASEIDSADPLLALSRPRDRRARLVCAHPYSLKRPIRLKLKAVLVRGLAQEVKALSDGR